MHKTDENNVFNQMLNKKWFTLIGWIVTIILAGIILYAPQKIILIKYLRLESTMYISFHRIGWSIMICWMIYACTMGHGGKVGNNQLD